MALKLENTPVLIDLVRLNTGDSVWQYQITPFYCGTVLPHLDAKNSLSDF